MWYHSFTNMHIFFPDDTVKALILQPYFLQYLLPLLLTLHTVQLALPKILIVFLFYSWQKDLIWMTQRDRFANTEDLQLTF